MWVGSMLETLPNSIRVILARILLVVLTFSLIWLLRSLLVWLLSKPLERLLARAGHAEMDHAIRLVISRPSKYLLLALAIDVGARILEVNPALMAFVTNVTRTFVIIALTLGIYSLVDIVVFSRRRFFLTTGIAVDEALLPFIRTGVQLLAWALALVIVIQIWGYDVSGLIAGLGIGGLAISLAAQDTLSNVFGFATIVSDRPFVVGEYIKTSEVEGVIEKVGLRSTRVRQLDQAVVTVPNSKLASSVILNWSRLAKRRVDFNLGVTYMTKPDQMETLLDQLRTMLQQRETVDPDSVVVYFIEFGQSALNILVRCYVNIAEWRAFTSEKERILLEVMRVVDSVGLQIAFPSQSLYIENLDNNAGNQLNNHLGSGLNLSEQPLQTQNASDDKGADRAPIPHSGD